MRSAPARWYFADTPATHRAVLARGATPRNPRVRSAPARWYFADTPAAHRAKARFVRPVTIASP